MKRETKLISRQNLDFVCDPCLYAYGAFVQAACEYEMVQIKHSQCFILIIKYDAKILIYFLKSTNNEK